MTDPALDIREQAPLAPLTTFRVGGPARYLVTCRTAADIPRAVAFARSHHLPFTVLGGGSNVLVSDDGFDGVVLHLSLKGVVRLEECDGGIRLRVAAGEDWDAFVARCVEAGWWGVENLSGIPGTVGAGPVQNIGAYGQEIRDTLEAVEAWDTQEPAWRILTSADCGFGYRSSIFNGSQAGRYIIAQVAFRLPLRGQAILSHASVSACLARHAAGVPPTPVQMRECIMALRTDGRLPDVRTTGSAGSFFKNAFLSERAFAQVQERVRVNLGAGAAERIGGGGRPFRTDAGVKVPAGELIRLCGLAGSCVGGAGLHPANPLVIVNATGRATAAEIAGLGRQIVREVWRQTGVELEPEPRFIGFRAAETAAWRAGPSFCGGDGLG
jgi:UDP-N-acetylmuramate dehydrogenase